MRDNRLGIAPTFAGHYYVGMNTQNDIFVAKVDYINNQLEPFGFSVKRVSEISLMDALLVIYAEVDGKKNSAKLRNIIIDILRDIAAIMSNAIDESKQEAENVLRHMIQPVSPRRRDFPKGYYYYPDQDGVLILEFEVLSHIIGAAEAKNKKKMRRSKK